ncbi:MAG TPA: cell division protein ZipA C-terminal FtsZ-binding domain-containing protein [Verrucomicrobiae bacterium]|nr:cell division protein ZipA C-terminal FtsZ-binding domain-containing protein [Verrucomicrobiae bacterium]
MSSLQWALLLLGVVIVGLLVFSSRREKKVLERLATPPPQPPASRDWGMERDAMAGSSERTGTPSVPSSAPFDEFGVSKPRRRSAPEVGDPAPAAPSVATAPRVPDKVIGLYIAEHEGTNILGPKIHAALADRGLRYGPRRVYHRYQGDQPLFSVASLVKPGALDPQEAEGFATPGLSIFMVLPGPAHPVAAFQDMLDTARALARSLNAQLYDSEQRAPLTAERERILHQQVEDWARQYTPAGRLGV